MTCSALLQEGHTEQYQMPVAPRKVCVTVLLLMPRDCGQVPAHPRKNLQDSVAAAFQGLWRITTHIWHQASPRMTLFQHQRMWLFSWAHWGLAFGGPTQPLPGVLPAGEPPLPMWPGEPWTPLCSWGFALPIRALPGIELWCSDSELPLLIVLMKFKLSPFSFLPF